MLDGLRRGVRHAAGGVLDLLYPPCCLNCGVRLPTAAVPLCTRCIEELEPAGAGAAEERLARLPEADGIFSSAFACWRFDRDGALQHVQHALKYGNRPRYGRAMGRYLGRAYREAFPRRDVPDAVAPIPLHRTRRLERGYNQSARLAAGMADVLAARLTSGMLVRARPTRSQTSLSRSERWDNVEGAFAATSPAAVQGRTVLLVDDVLTTGSTAAAAANALRAADAASVHLATLALARS